MRSFAIKIFLYVGLWPCSVFASNWRIEELRIPQERTIHTLFEVCKKTHLQFKQRERIGKITVGKLTAELFVQDQGKKEVSCPETRKLDLKLDLDGREAVEALLNPKFPWKDSVKFERYYFEARYRVIHDGQERYWLWVTRTSMYTPCLGQLFELIPEPKAWKLRLQTDGLNSYTFYEGAFYAESGDAYDVVAEKWFSSYRYSKAFPYLCPECSDGAEATECGGQEVCSLETAKNFSEHRSANGFVAAPTIVSEEVQARATKNLDRKAASIFVADINQKWPHKERPDISRTLALIYKAFVGSASQAWIGSNLPSGKTVFSKDFVIKGATVQVLVQGWIYQDPASAAAELHLDALSLKSIPAKRGSNASAKTLFYQDTKEGGLRPSAAVPFKVPKNFDWKGATNPFD